MKLYGRTFVSCRWILHPSFRVPIGLASVCFEGNQWKLHTVRAITSLYQPYGIHKEMRWRFYSKNFFCSWPGRKMFNGKIWDLKDARCGRLLVVSSCSKDPIVYISCTSNKEVKEYQISGIMCFLGWQNMDIMHLVFRLPKDDTEVKLEHIQLVW